VTFEPEVWSGPIVDEPAPVSIDRTSEIFHGRIWSVRKDRIALHGQTVERDVIVHPGAVAVIALDADDRVLLVRQYRHPVGLWLFEPPAGLLDVAGEPPWRTAERELAEEAGYRAASWWVLIDLFNTPGGSTEAIRIYLARDLEPLDDGRPVTGEAEEAHLPQTWIPLSDARDLVLSGAIGSPTAVAGILAAVGSRAEGWGSLRPRDAAWSVRDHLLATGRVHNHREAEGR
jgi:8-oxo-dGTP pyrophosphatase MutT (NUDIX family)